MGERRRSLVLPQAMAVLRVRFAAVLKLRLTVSFLFEYRRRMRKKGEATMNPASQKNTLLCSNCGGKFVDTDTSTCCLAPSPKRGFTMEEAIALLRELSQRNDQTAADDQIAA